MACGGGETQQTKLVKEYTQKLFDDKTKTSVEEIFGYYSEANKKINSLTSVKKALALIKEDTKANGGLKEIITSEKQGKNKVSVSATIKYNNDRQNILVFSVIKEKGKFVIDKEALKKSN